MGLPAAMKAHAAGDLQLAAKHYKRALDQKQYKDILFQNYGAILRELGDLGESERIYRLGLELFPSSEGILRNFANLICKTKPTEALAIHFDLIGKEIRSSSKNQLADELFLQPLEILESINCIDWAYLLGKFVIQNVQEVGPKFLVTFFRIATNPKKVLLSSEQQLILSRFIESKLFDSSLLLQAEYYFALAWVQIQRSEVNNAQSSFDIARKRLSSAVLFDDKVKVEAQEINNRHSWNIACMLLSHQKFNEGWQLFEHGLMVEAKGGQKWQRALPKPFTHAQLTLWRGELLIGKKILFLEEQAVGDVMQFLTLLPAIIEEASHVGILINNRLISIYRISFSEFIASGKLSIHSFEDVAKDLLRTSDFDFQSPLGSVCHHRFNDISLYGTNTPVLIADQNITSTLRLKYLNSFSRPVSRLIGVSWRGGGTSTRIKEKSLDIEQFTQLLVNFDDIGFVSLQYGEAKAQVDSWNGQGINILHDSTINPLQDMSLWLSQVAACDAVISVANTTIHGSGGLNIPTMCLLSLHSDWRWLRNPDVTRSYWYPSVGIARQIEGIGWSPAIANVRNWLSTGSSYPTGRTHADQSELYYD